MIKERTTKFDGTSLEGSVELEALSVLLTIVFGRVESESKFLEILKYFSSEPSTLLLDFLHLGCRNIMPLIRLFKSCERI